MRQTAVKTGAGHGFLAPEAFEWLFTLAAIAFLVRQSEANRDAAVYSRRRRTAITKRWN